MTAIIQNGVPFTYFQDRPIDLADECRARLGRARGERAPPSDRPGVPLDRLARALAARASERHRNVTGISELTELTVSSADERPLPLQVDGDYLGERRRGALLDHARTP